MAFKVNHRDHTGTLIQAFFPEDLRFTLNKKDVHTCQYARSHAAGDMVPSGGLDAVGAYRTDFELIWFDPSTLAETIIMSGMHVPAPEVHKQDGFTTIYGKDWKHYLQRRHYPFDPSTPTAYNHGTPPLGYAIYSNADVTVHVKNMLDTTLAMANSLALTYPTLGTAVGIPTNFQLAWADTTDILSLISGLSDVAPGFDYEILNTKEFRIYAPHKYDPASWNTPSVCNYTFDSTNQNLITSGPEYVNNGPQATHWFGYGSGIGQNSTQVGCVLGMPAAEAVYRRLDESQNYDQVKSKADIHLRSMKDFAWAANPAHDIRFSVQAEHIANFWTLFQPGYAIWLDNDLTSHHIQSAQEIVQMDCQADGHGGCEVTFGLNELYDPTTAGVNEP
jgi:hypothetical protein